jgi:hypothetical protein
MTTEVEKLLSLIYQGGQIKIENSQLFVSPPEIARKFGEQIKKLKPEILIAFGHCPVCGRELTVKIEELREKRGRHSYCSGSEPWHYDNWEF